MTQCSSIMSSIWLSWFSFNGKCSSIPEAISIFVSAGCVCLLALQIWRDRKQNRKDPRILTKSASIGLLHGGKLAMQRLLDSHIALANDMATLSEAETQLKNLLKKETHDFKELQRTVGKLEMSSKEAEAIKMLNQARNEAKEQGKHHEAYEFQMLLVEMFIYEGNLKEARSCECLEDKEISDARRPLYKAIISILEGRYEIAKMYWDKFQETRKEFKSLYCGEEPINEVANHFEKFLEQVINSLSKKKKAHQVLD